ncbi:MAG: Na+/H+ antiporter NhaA [Spongiibacteraceae bacterium]
MNDGLMTVFFLVVGMEIRREIKDGALKSFKLAALPVGCACRVGCRWHRQPRCAR